MNMFLYIHIYIYRHRTYTIKDVVVICIYAYVYRYIYICVYVFIYVDTYQPTPRLYEHKCAGAAPMGATCVRALFEELEDVAPAGQVWLYMQINIQDKGCTYVLQCECIYVYIYIETWLITCLPTHRSYVHVHAK